MKLNKQIIIAFTCIFPFGAVVISCKKDDLTGDAVIRDYGDPLADGCGWVIKLNGSDSLYSPKNLPQIYQQDSLKVHISFHKLKTTYYCGATQIQLDEIRKSQ